MYFSILRIEECASTICENVPKTVRAHTRYFFHFTNGRRYLYYWGKRLKRYAELQVQYKPHDDTNIIVGRGESPPQAENF